MAPFFLSYVNGEYTQEAKISVLDLGLIRGYGVFDFLRTYGKQPFHLAAHLKRFRTSAQLLQLSVTQSDENIRAIIQELLLKNSLPEAHIRLILTGGESSDNLLPEGKPNFLVLVRPITPYPPQLYLEGISIITFQSERFLPECKSLNYIPAILALLKAKEQKAIEALYMNSQREVLEGTTSNFFLFKRGVLITPQNGILPGITRDVVLKLTQNTFPIELRPVQMEELSEAEEVFLTASNKEIMPVVRINNATVGNGKVGKGTKEVMRLFREYTLNPPWPQNL